MTYIFKFGGSSLLDASKIKQVARFIKGEKQNNKLYVVVSAMGKTTNKLVELSESLGGETNKEYASLVSLGEQISANALAVALNKLGVQTEVLTAKKLIYASGDFDSGTITDINVNRLKKIPKQKVAIICGFQGENEKGETVLLGRGGSDTTAVALGAVLKAKVKIYTDVKGFYTCDPNKFKNAKLLKKINVNSALNLANAGAKVLDKRSLMLANKYKVNLEVLKSMNKRGTQIEYGELEGYHIDGVSYLTNLFMLKGESINVPPANIKKQICLLENGKSNQYTIFGVSKNWKPSQNATPCEILLIAGSGLDTFQGVQTQILKMVQKVKTSVYMLDITSTTITIITKKDLAKKFAEQLVNITNG